MEKNVGGIDKKIRIGVGAILVLLTLFGQIGTWGYLGLIPLLTGVFSLCPLYTLLGKNTCNRA